MKATEPALLFIEDSDIDFELISLSVSQFQPTGRIARAPTGDAARKLLITGSLHPSMIVFDIQLGGENGLDLMAELKNVVNPNQTSMVVFSTSGNEQERRRAFDQGADDFFVKPFDPHEFIHTVRTMVSKWSCGKLTGE